MGEHAREDLNGMTYKEHLNSLPEAEGLLVEIERTCNDVVTNMRGWDFDRPDFLELGYEDLIEDEDGCFQRVFAHYGLSEAAIASSLQIARRHSFATKAGRAIGDVAGGSHLRSGKAGQWRSEFGPEHVALMKGLGNDVLIRLGYESDDDWTV
ncbi:MAG: sulfotransferase domain-containing protein [Actinomycetota bacterium]